jgi:hypothetical protein
MTEWYDSPYKGGPMVKVTGFPRPLYPPDAKKYGKIPSEPGPDVVAYKRTVSRAGRWPWQSFDEVFSNQFSHGKGTGNVVDSGVSGVQRQQHLDATGWIGENTFNTLRSIRVPEGKPHAGEMAMDGTAVSLINQAYAKFGGEAPPPPPTDNVRQAALKRAITQIGIKESPPGSNLNIYGQWYGFNGVPWCAEFATWCFVNGAADVNKTSPVFSRGRFYAYVPYIVGDARAKRNGLQTVDDPIPGDLACYDWGWDGIFDHVGIFEEMVGKNSFHAIEGNTGTVSASNGGEVMRATRVLGLQRTVFVRVKEPT